MEINDGSHPGDVRDLGDTDHHHHHRHHVNINKSNDDFSNIVHYDHQKVMHPDNDHIPGVAEITRINSNSNGKRSHDHDRQGSSKKARVDKDEDESLSWEDVGSLKSLIPKEIQGWNWHTKETNILRGSPAIKERVRFRCSNCRKFVDGVACKARYHVDVHLDGHLAFNIVEIPHNHEPPPKVRVNSSMQRLLQRASDTMKSGKISITSTITKEDKKPPNPASLTPQSSKSDLGIVPRALSGLPKPLDFIVNAYNSLTNYGDFLQRVSMLNMSTAYIIMGTQTSLELLCQNSRRMSIHKTMEDVSEGYMTLTTILSQVNGVDVPLVFILSNVRKLADHEEIWEIIKKMCGGELRPEIIASDYDEASMSALGRCFPKATLRGEFFHFLEENRKFIISRERFELIDDVATSLWILWSSPNQTQYKINETAFLSFWFANLPEYATYFSNMWVHTNKPENWAYFSRASLNSNPTDHQAVEHYNRRLIEAVLGNEKTIPLGELVKKLRDEVNHEVSVVSNAVSLSERLAGIEIFRKMRQHSTENMLDWIISTHIPVDPTSLVRNPLGVVPVPQSLAPIRSDSSTNPFQHNARIGIVPVLP